MVKRDRSSSRPAHTSKRAVDPIAGLAGSIAHDFSNLLMIIRNAGAFLKDDLSPDDPRQEHVSQLLHAADRAVRLTQQLQAIGRSQLLKLEPVRPAEIIRGIAGALRDLVPEDVEFRMSIRAAEATVRFDAAQLPVVVMNLVSYAAERVRSHARILLAIGEETVDKKKAEKHAVTPGRYLTILIANTGQSLEETETKRIFKPGLAGKSLPRGTDLRLASVHGIVTQSGGFVDVASEVAQGTTLMVFLPIVPVEEQLRPDPVPHVRIYKDSTGAEIILVVEDDDEVRAMIREGLERYGYTVLEASDGEEALRITELFNAPPDLLLTDLVMPHVTGRELIEGLRLEGRLPKVLMMSGYTDDEVLRRSRPATAYPFIRKPFTHVELAAKVREVLDS